MVDRFVNQTRNASEDIGNTMNKKLKLLLCVGLLAGVVYCVILISNMASDKISGESKTRKGSEKNGVRLTAADLEYEPEQGYYTGSVKVGEERIEVKYRRIKEPITITEEFRWDENTRRSPLDSLLTSMSLIMRNERIDSTLSKENLRFYHEQLKEMSEEELLAVTKRLISEAVVLGEIVCNEVTVVVIRRKSGDYYSYLGNWFVERNGEFLRYSDIVLENPLYQTLARDQYSLVTGYQPE